MVQKKLNNFELNQQLDKYKKELHEILDTDETLSKVEIVTTLYAEFEDNEEELEASKDYYNDNVTIYNKLVHCFPSNLIAILFHYKHKDFYIDEKEEMFEILKDDKRQLSSFFSSIFQLISGNPLLLKNALVLEKGLLPKKPLNAESGEG